MRPLYSLSIYLLNFAIQLAALFNSKAKLWVNGRKGQFNKMRKQIKPGEQIIWFHCSSLGEFEQGRPVIEEVRSNYSNHKILLTFFSPSGYEIRKNTEIADYVYYLPIDTPKNAKKFLQIVKPRIAFFVKYEFWFNYINELSKNKIPTFVVSSIFTSSKYFFKPWGKWSVKQLQKITHFFVQDENSLELLNSVKVYHVDIGGDTRFDRVLKLVSENLEFPIIEDFKNNQPLFIAGSTWPADEEILFALLKKMPAEYKMIIAPHEINQERIGKLLKKFNVFNPGLYSNNNTSRDANNRVLIINNMGMLSHIYRYASVAYIGGGFGVGIHNVLEAATYGLPVIFGPNYKNFNEAVELIAKGGGFSISNASVCIEAFNTLYGDTIAYQKSSEASSDYVNEKAGATALVLDKIKSYLVID